jgi:hypothetical protein
MPTWYEIRLERECRFPRAAIQSPDLTFAATLSSPKEGRTTSFEVRNVITREESIDGELFNILPGDAEQSQSPRIHL